MLLPHSLLRRRLRLMLLSALAFAAAFWLLSSGGQRKEIPQFDARLLEQQYPLVWKHIHSFDGVGGGKPLLTLWRSDLVA